LSRSGLGRRKSDPAAPVQSPCSIFDQAGRFPLGSEPCCGEHRPCKGVARGRGTVHHHLGGHILYASRQRCRLW